MMENQNWTQYELDTVYEITMTFEDKWQYIAGKSNYGLKRIKKFNDFLNEEYLPKCQVILGNYNLYTELSDPQQIMTNHGKYPRLHLHGTFKTSNEYDDLLSLKLSISDLGKYGRIQINKYRYDYWEKYIKKDYNKYKKFLKHYHYPDKKLSPQNEPTEMLMVNYV